jgi:hypothetical protein
LNDVLVLANCHHQDMDAFTFELLPPLTVSSGEITRKKRLQTTHLIPSEQVGLFGSTSWEAVACLLIEETRI